ncbi:M15 family metallopeptidase [Thermoactinomyces mirandus]|uniref:M15 family metallopeptidase n=1 Tax=Thermoactinomyces mirandus TaxID=2756294 RepID=A0A7W2AR00_9BACL|nr:M15 family metallopeptidase [Thermoactinomyces mirandus]MBA4601792.1 M15 family metallopeptidase [Thermoactinomyces mirandus]
MKNKPFIYLAIPAVIGSMVLLGGCYKAERPVAAKDVEKKQAAVIQEKPKPLLPEEKWDIDTPSSLTIIVNKDRELPADYVPPDLVKPDVSFSSMGWSEKKLMRKEAAEALEKLFQAAGKEGVKLVAVSGYRSYERQQQTYQSALKRKGQASTSRYNARPGQSEHQTGLAMDVSTPSVDCQLNESFGETEAGRWLENHAAEFGFIIRYGKGKEEVTGYSYEPWHIRYVGKELATILKQKGLAMEEYFSLVQPKNQ